MSGGLCFSVESTTVRVGSVRSIHHANRLLTHESPSGPLGLSLPDLGGYKRSASKRAVRSRRREVTIRTTQDSPVRSSGQPTFLIPLFAINARRDGDAYVIRIKGELDLSECPHLECALREAEASHAIEILLDLEELTFIDAAGLSVLVAAWRRSVTDRNRLQMTRGKGNVAYMFRLTELDMALPFVRSRLSIETSESER